MATRTNLSINPSFEYIGTGNGLQGWNQEVGAWGTWGRFKYHAGGAALSANAAGGLLVSDAAPASPGLSYSAQVYVQEITGAGDNITVGLRFLNAGGGTISEALSTTAVPYGLDVWVRRGNIAVAPANTASVKMVLGANTNGGFFDGALLEQSATAGNYFDGTTVQAGYSYSWTSAAHNSTSIEVPPTAPNGLTILVQDNFDRANSSTVIGSPQIGVAPAVYSGVGGIAGNALYQTSGTLVVGWNLGTPNVELSATANLVSTTNGVALALGITSATDHYYFFAQTNTLQLIRAYTGGGLLLLTSSAIKLPAASGSVLRTHYRDGVIRCYVDDVLVIRWAVEAPITSTVHGVRLINTVVRMDNLLGTDAPTIAEDYTGGLQSNALTMAATDPQISQAFVYRGRDTQTQDAAAGA
jgi:hypothetical protein